MQNIEIVELILLANCDVKLYVPEFLVCLYKSLLLVGLLGIRTPDEKN